MARKTISQRIALEGGDQIRKQLSEFGTAGEKAFKAVQDAADKLKGPGAQFAKSMDAAKKKAEELGKSMREVGTSMRDFGAGMSVAVTAPVGLIGASFIKAASDAQESASAFDALFKDQADSVREWGATVADELGRGNQVILDQAAAFQKLFDQVQPNKGAAADLSKEFTVLAQDLASFYNMTEDEALGKLMSGLAGETEPLRDFGVFLNAAAIEAQAMKMGLVGVNNELTDQEKVLASAQLILEKTVTAQGDAARTSGSFANQLKRLRGEWADLSVQMGNIILPYALKVVQAFADMAQAFQELSPATQTAILVISGLAAVVAPILATVGLMTIGIGGLATAFAAIGGILAPVVAWFASLGAAGGGLAATFGALGPVLASIAAVLLSWPVLIAGLVASFAALGVAIYRNWDDISAKLKGLFDRLDGMADGVVASLREAVQSGLSAIGQFVSAWFDNFVGLAANAWSLLPEGLQEAGEAIKGMFSGVWDFIEDKFKSLDKWADGIVKSIRDKVQDVLRLVGMANDSGGSSGSTSGSSVPGYASGGRVDGQGPAVSARRSAVANGPIRGPGTGTSDSIVSGVRTGSFIIRARAVRHYGSRLLDQLNRLRVPATGAARVRATASGPQRTILARLSNGEFAVRPEAVRHYGPQLFELLNRLRLPKDRMPVFAKGGNVVNVGGAISNVTNRLRQGVMPVFADGGIVSNIQNFGDRVSTIGDRVRNTLSHLRQTTASAIPAISIAAPGIGSPSQPASRVAPQSAPVVHVGGYTLSLPSLRLPERVAALTAAAGGISSSLSTARTYGARLSQAFTRIVGPVQQFAPGGAVSNRSVQNISHALGNYRSQVSQVANRMGAVLPAFAMGGPVSTQSVQSVGNTVRNYGSRLSNALNYVGGAVSGTTFGGSVMSNAVRNVSQSIQNYRSRISEVMNQAGAVLPAFASGGHVSNTTLRSHGDAIRNYGARLSQTFNSVGSLPAFASGGMASNVRNYGAQLGGIAAMMGAPMVLMPALATGGLVTTTPSFASAGSGQQGSSAPVANISLTIGNERFDGLTAPRETADRLVRHAMSEEVKSAGRRPNWYRGIG